MSIPPPRSSNVVPSSVYAEHHGLSASYTNVFRASGSAEELILDFGLDPHRRTPEGAEQAVMLQRLVLTWGHAKRLAFMLRDLVQMHETSHGTIPLDNTKPPANPPIALE